MANLLIRLASLGYVLALLWYLPWLLISINLNVAWFAIPFALANLMVIASASLTMINNWHRTQPTPALVPEGAEPVVGVFIPTCKEPVEMVANTIKSVLKQNWPHAKLRIIVGDDGHLPEVAQMVAEIKAQYPDATLVYFEPPRRGEATRRGDAKAGNLNAQLDYLLENFGKLDFIETRDADDEVCDVNFLRNCIAQLLIDEKLAYVQTIKETRVSFGDPFCNNETLFYRGAMLARHSSNAVFPCGSGLVWRLTALKSIGGFPTWNLVEDLQSGVEALRRGWKSLYLPIVGVLSQHAPEDIPNVYKQRGVWALDTIRLLIWGKVMKGLNFWQKLHFIELGIFYALSFAIVVFLVTPAINLFLGVYPLQASNSDYNLHFWPFAISVELLLCALNGRQSYLMLWRAREMWVGLSAVYIKACISGVLCGPNRKPVYKVTRKTHSFGWYWRETRLHTLVFFFLAASITYSLLTKPWIYLDYGSIFWAIFMMTILGCFLRKSWFGLDLTKHLQASIKVRMVQSWQTVGKIRVGVLQRVKRPLTTSLDQFQSSIYLNSTVEITVGRLMPLSTPHEELLLHRPPESRDETANKLP